MKKAIKGMRYDTESADKVCDVREGMGKSDARSLDAALYKTRRSKQFFLAGYGGGLTVLASRNADGTTSGGYDLVVLDEETARDFAERHAPVETVEKFFTLQDA